MTFTKIRKWANEVGATVQDSKYFNKITVTLTSGRKFELENRESTSRRVWSRGGSVKWSGSPAGLYFMEVPEMGHGYSHESTQARAIEDMKKHL